MHEDTRTQRERQRGQADAAAIRDELDELLSDIDDVLGDIEDQEQLARYESTGGE